MKTKTTAIDLLPYAWLLLLIGICISPRFKELNNIFYLTFLPLTLVSLRQYYAELIRTPIYIWLLTLSGWMALSSTWASNPDYSDLKAIGYVVFFITGCALIEETKAIAKWGCLIPIALGIQLYFSAIPGQRLLGFGPMENPLYAGQFYLFFTWFFVYYKQFHSKPIISTLTRWFGFFMSAGACYLTQSRSVIFCLILLILVSFLHNYSYLIKSQKKPIAVLITLVFICSTALLFNNKWITLPSDYLNYQVNLNAGEVVRIKYLGSTKPTTFPRVETPQGTITTMEQNPNYRKYLFTATKAGNYHFEIKLDEKTTVPWQHVRIYTKEPNEPFQLLKKFTPPRAFQFELSFGYRTEIWPIRLQQCLEKPFFGYGFSQSSPIPFKGGFVNDSHNFFLGTAFHGGIIALLIYVGLLAICLYTLCKNKLWGYASLLLCGIITTSFDDEKFFSSTRPYWLLLLFPIGKALKVSMNQKQAFFSSLLLSKYQTNGINTETKD